MKRLAAVLLAFFAFAAACGGTVADRGGSDAGSAADSGTKDAASDAASSSLDAGNFCTGATPRMVVNGSDVTVLSVSGKSVALNCCDSAELMVATSAYQASFDVLWRAPAGATAVPVDLSTPPSGFTIELDLGCDPTTTSCASASPEERYADGFAGDLQVATGASGTNVSYCISVAESSSAPHATIHSLKLYAPNVTSTF